jgi:hypothetical protein
MFKKWLKARKEKQEREFQKWKEDYPLYKITPNVDLCYDLRQRRLYPSRGGIRYLYDNIASYKTQKDAKLAIEHLERDVIKINPI